MLSISLWVDDLRDTPNDNRLWWHARSVNEAKRFIEGFENGLVSPFGKFELIDIDHDAGDYAKDGGDFINVLNWLEETGRNYPIRIHTMNPVGAENMRKIIRKNGWQEVV